MLNQELSLRTIGVLSLVLLATVIADTFFLDSSRQNQLILTFKPIVDNESTTKLFSKENSTHKQFWIINQGPVTKDLDQLDLILSNGRWQYRMTIDTDGQEIPLVIDDQIKVILISIQSDRHINLIWKSPISSGTQDMSILPELAVILR